MACIKQCILVPIPNREGCIGKDIWPSGQVVNAENKPLWRHLTRDEVKQYVLLINYNVYPIDRYCFPFGRPEGALKATLSLLERVCDLTMFLMAFFLVFQGCFCLATFTATINTVFT